MEKNHFLDKLKFAETEYLLAEKWIPWGESGWSRYPDYPKPVPQNHAVNAQKRLDALAEKATKPQQTGKYIVKYTTFNPREHRRTEHRLVRDTFELAKKEATVLSSMLNVTCTIIPERAGGK